MDNPQVKILITNNDKNLGVIKDFSQLSAKNTGLIGQLIAELELMKRELLFIYSGGLEDEENWVCKKHYSL